MECIVINKFLPKKPTALQYNKNVYISSGIYNELTDLFTQEI